MPTDVIAERPGEIDRFYVRVGDLEAMLKNVDACTDCGFGKLYLADILLGQIDRGSMAFVSENKDEAFIFEMRMCVFNFGYMFRDGRGQGCFGFKPARKINDARIKHNRDSVDKA